MMLLALKFTVL